MLRLTLPCCALLLCACGDDPTAPTETEAPTDAIPLTLIDLDFGDETLALLQGPDSLRVVLPTEPCPASSVDLRLDGFDFPRPLTHDLLISAADSLDLPITEVLLELTDGIPHAHITLGGNPPTELDATVGDGLAIHQQAQVPLLATPELVAAYTDTIPAGKTTAPEQPMVEGPLRIPSARLAQSDTFVAVRMLGLAQTGNALAVVLIDLDDQLVFPFFIGFCQAASINATFNRLTAREASTHILFHELLTTARTTVAYARITELREDVYYGELGLTHRGRTLVLDSRPSDAVALALRTGATIEIAETLLATVGEEAGPYIDLFAAGKRTAPDFFPVLGNF